MCCAGTLSTRGACILTGALRSPLRTITAEKWSCLLLRIVLQDAVNEVIKVFAFLKLKVFVDDITARMEWRNKELRGNAARCGSEAGKAVFKVVDYRRKERR